MVGLADALLDFQERPGRHAVALREPRVLFERVSEVLALASGRSVEGLPADPQVVDALREAARFFVRTALLRPGADHFSLLGLTPGFDPAILREHYRMLIRMTHPDFASAAGVAWPADAATRINLANDVLSSDERREAYAQSLQRPRSTGGPAPAPARWAKDPWHTEPSGKRWPAVAAGLGVVALLAFWLWPSQTPQERLARLAAEAQEQELAAQQAAKEAQAAQVAAADRAAAAPTPAVPTQTPPAVPARNPPAAPNIAATSPTVTLATSSAVARPTPPAPPSTLAQARSAPVPAPAPAASRATAAPTTAALAAGGSTLKLSQAVSLPPERAAATRPSPVAPPAAALESPARTTAIPAQALTAQKTAAAPTSANAAALAPSPAIVTAAVPSPPAAPAPAPAAQAHGFGGSVSLPAPSPTVAAASPPAAAPSTAPLSVATAPAGPAAAAAERVAAAQPAPVPSPTRNTGNSPRMSEVQPLLNQLLGALQSGRGDAAVRLIDTMARQSGAGAGFSEAYERTLGGGRLLRIGQVQFAGRPSGDQLVVDGVLQLQLQASGEDAAAAPREFVLRAVFASRGGQPVLTQLSPAGAGR
jgi:hypothetical protein